jgi:KDO2-lipid IV(A) lauroyltransferase
MHKTEYYITAALFALFKNISLKNAKRIADILCFIIAKIIRYRRDVIISNLNLVYGDHWPDHKKKLINDIYRNFTYLWVEFLQNDHVINGAAAESFQVHHWEVLEKALALGKGAIIITGHFGNFEWLGQYISKRGIVVNGIAKRQSNPYVNELVERNRSAKNIRVIYVKDAGEAIPKALKRNELVALVADQDAKEKGVFVNFLGQKSSTPVGPAVYHFKTGAPLVFGISVRKDYGKFDFYFEEINIEPFDELTKETIKKITQLHASILEKWTLQYPQQWFWVHKRWKTKPE